MFLNSEPLNGFAETGIGGVYQAHKATHANVATPTKYEPGTICRYWNSYLKGEGACVYAYYLDGSASAVVSAGDGVLLKAGTTYTVTNDYSDGNVTGGTPFAIACMTMTDAYYGWFWISGVPPYFMTAASTRFDEATITTAGSVTAGAQIQAHTTDGGVIVYTEAGTTVQAAIGVAGAADSGTDLALTYVRLYGLGWF